LNGIQPVHTDHPIWYSRPDAAGGSSWGCADACAAAPVFAGEAFSDVLPLHESDESDKSDKTPATRLDSKEHLAVQIFIFLREPVVDANDVCHLVYAVNRGGRSRGGALE
jgi:hypothetical protein